METIKSVGVAGYSVVRVNIDGLPRELTSVDGRRWCVWLAKARDNAKPGDKPAKVPMGTGGALCVDKPESWLSFDDAVKLYAKSKYDGIGVLMSSLPDIVGLDLDNCIDADGKVADECSEIVSDFVGLGGYIEVSPSGTGLRQFLRGALPSGYAEKLWNLEIYSTASKRYLTVTGVKWGDGALNGFPRNDDVLAAFMAKWGKAKIEADTEAETTYTVGGMRTSQEVIGLMLANDKSGKAARLMVGDLSDYNGDHSSADLALCCLAAYYCRDPAIIDGVMRISNLMREKWERRDYRERTIREALKTVTSNWDDFADDGDGEGEGEGEGTGGKRKRGRPSARNDEADKNLVGGGADLRGKNGWRRDIWALSQMLLRDRRLLGVVYWDSFAFRPTLTRSLRDAFDDAQAPDTVGALTDAHILAVQAWFGRHYGLNVRKPDAADVVVRWAHQVTRNPVAEYFDSLKWNGKAGLDTWLIDLMGAVTVNDAGEDISPYVRAVGAKWLIGMVRRGRKPGAKVDTMLVLEGKQGAKKSSAIRIAAETVGEQYFREGFHIGGGDKDLKLALRGRLVVEWAEMSGISKKDANEIKNFLTLQVDQYRSVFGMMEQDWPRTAVFAATTNDSDYLVDPTGGRRFWPVKLKGRINIDRLKAVMPQLLAEAAQREAAGERHWFDEGDPRELKILQMAESEQQRRMSVSFWDEITATISDKLVRGELVEGDTWLVAIDTKAFSGDQMRRWISVEAGGLNIADNTTWRLVAAGLRTAGWEQVKMSSMHWRLTTDRREQLRDRWGVESDPQWREAQAAIKAASTRAKVEGRKGVVVE